MKTVIIGGGPAGLLYAMYHPDSIVITDKVGGGFSAPFQLGPKFLHKTAKTEQLLKDIGKEYPTKTVKVGFYYDNKINPANSDENRKNYFEKTRGITAEPYKSSMSEGSNEFEAYDVDLNELVNSIYEVVKHRVTIAKVFEVNLQKKIISTEVLPNQLLDLSDFYEFDKLVVTCPRPIFDFMIGQPEEAKKFVSYPTTFVETMFLPDAVTDYIHPSYGQFDQFNEYDYVYFSQKELTFHRISKIPGGRYCIEFKGDKVEKQESELNRFTLKTGQIIQREDTIEYPDFVKFFGRFATWKHSVKVKEMMDELI